jgi:predicted RNase H-like HicB family nuclease
MKRATVIIEKGKDHYAAFVANGLKNHALNGTGESVKKAIKDLHEALEELREMYIDDSESIPKELEDVKFEYKYDVASLFDHFGEINISSFARKIEMNESLLRKYKKGLAVASEKQCKRIKEGLHELGRSLIAAQL